MILADTSVWIDYFRGWNPEMRRQLGNVQIVTHPLIVAELALGSLHERRKTLAYLEMLPEVKVAQLGEVRSLIEHHKLYNKGIGVIDAHLLAATLLEASVRLWTLDKRLRIVAEGLGIHVDIS